MVDFRKIGTPEGLLLFDRQTGLNVLLDELKGRYRWEKPLYVALAITNRCNRLCQFCYARSGPSGEEGVWTRERILGLCRFLDSYGVLGVAFAGGEAFTYPHFAEICREVWDTTGLDVGVTTNGDLVTDEDLATLKGHFGQLRVSVWHPSEVQKKVKRLLGKGVDIGVNTILFRGGFETVRGVVEEGLKVGINDFLVLACKVYGRAMDSMAPDTEDVRKLAEYIRKHQGVGFKVDPALSASLAREGIRFLQPWIEEKSGPRFLSITYDGYVKPDSFSDTKVQLERFEQLPAIYQSFFGNQL